MQVLDFHAPNIVPFPPEDYGMTTKERLDGIDSRLDGIDSRLNRIDTTLGLSPPKPRSVFAQSRDHLWQQIRTHKATIIPIVAIVVGVGGWFGSGWFRYYLDHKDDSFNGAVDGRLDKKLGEAGGINKRLDTMNESLTKIGTALDTLKPFIEDLVRLEMGKAAALPSAELQKRLPAVNHLVAVAKNQRIAVDPATARTLGAKISILFRQNLNTPELWQVGSQLVSYRSEIQFPGLLSKQNLPACGTVGPVSRSSFEDFVHSAPKDWNKPMTPYVFANCILDLEDFDNLVRQHAHAEIHDQAGTRDMLLYPPYEFRSAIIRYNGGTFPTEELQFVDCLFQINLQQEPPPKPRQMLITLLTSNVNEITVPKT